MTRTGLGGLDALAPRSKLYQGPFGRLFPELDGWTPDVPADVVASQMVERPGVRPQDIAADPDEVAALEAEFDSRIPAGYTYFGQFVDHDITFDPASSRQRRNDPSGLLNFRTPRLDLDCVYGRGHADQPYLFDGDDPAKLLVGQIAGSDLPDLPRNAQGRALIGDMRNDENSMVCQVQLAMLLAHNTLVDRARAAGVPDAEVFDEARRVLTWLYQWVVWNDFVKRIVVDATHGAALCLQTTGDGRKRWARGLDDVYDWKHQPFMPVEFSVAAYRFGHSMVRNSYQTNAVHRGFGAHAPIFANTGDQADPDDLRGFRPLTAANVVQWDWFLDMGGPAPFPQKARKIDTKMANALAFLHEGMPGAPDNVLALRNLERGFQFDLPAGTAVAERLGFTPVKLADGEPDALWFYILKEAESLPGNNAGQMLGRVGSTIVAATFAGLLAGDPCSYFTDDPAWSPADEPLLHDGQDNQDSPGRWELTSLVRLSGLPVSAGDF